MEDSQPLCIICCYSYKLPPASGRGSSPAPTSVIKSPGKGQGNSFEKSHHYFKFVEHIANKLGIKLEELRFGFWRQEEEEEEVMIDNKLSICPECLLLIEQAMNRKGKADEVDEQISLLQMQVAAALSEFQGLMKEFHEEMKKIEQIVRCSDVTCLEFRIGKENMLLEHTHKVFLLRDSIVNAASGKISSIGGSLRTRTRQLDSPSFSSSSSNRPPLPVPVDPIKVELDDADDSGKWTCPTVPPTPGGLEEDPNREKELHKIVNTLPEKLLITERRQGVSKRKKIKSSESSMAPPIKKSRPSSSSSSSTKCSSTVKKLTKEFSSFPRKTPKMNPKQDTKIVQTQKRKEERRQKRLDTESSFRTRNRSLHARRDAFMYHCQRCPFKTRRIYSFEYHLRQYETSEKRYKCPEVNCLLQFSNKQFYDFHMTGHKGNYYYTNCEICQQFVVPAQIFQHMTDYHGRFVEKILQCPNCSYCCISRDKYLSHLRYHSRANGGGRFVCDVCYAEVPSRTKLLTHLHDVHAAIGKLQCGIGNCQRTSLCPEKMQQHRYIAHKSGSATCEACGKVLQSKHSLKNHLLIYHSSERRPLPCDQCTASFVSKPELDRHQIRKHNRERFKCEVCEKSFMDKTTLNRHRAHQHEGKGFQCSRCEKTFSAASRLKRHEMIHEPEKNWVCDYDSCGKAFRYKQQLQGHKLIHEGIKNFQCPHCNKAFVRSDNLACHLRVHTGERPFVCDVCGKAFNQSAALMVHKRNQHPVAPTSPPCATKIQTSLELEPLNIP